MFVNFLAFYEQTKRFMSNFVHSIFYLYFDAAICAMLLLRKIWFWFWCRSSNLIKDNSDISLLHVKIGFCLARFFNVMIYDYGEGGRLY